MQVKRQKGWRMRCDIGEVPMTEVKQRKGCRMNCDVGKATEGWGMSSTSFSNPSIALPTSQLIIQPFHCFTYVIGTSLTSQVILQPFRCFTYITAHSTTLLPLHLCHRSFYNPSIASPTSQLILQPFCHITYITAYSPTLLLLYLHHSSFSKTLLSLLLHDRLFTYVTW